MSKSHDTIPKPSVFQTASPATDDCANLLSLPPASYLVLPKRHEKAWERSRWHWNKTWSNPRKDQFATLWTFPSLSQYSCLRHLQMKRRVA